MRNHRNTVLAGVAALALLAGTGWLRRRSRRITIARRKPSNRKPPRK